MAKDTNEIYTAANGLDESAVGNFAALVNEQIRVVQSQGRLLPPHGLNLSKMLAIKVFGEGLPRDEIALREREVRAWLQGLDVPHSTITLSRLMDALFLTADNCRLATISKRCADIKDAYDLALEERHDALGLQPRVLAEDVQHVNVSHSGGGHGEHERFLPPAIHPISPGDDRPYDKLPAFELQDIMQKTANGGEFLRCYRHLLGYTQDEAAIKIGCSTTAYSDIEINRSIATAEILPKLRTRFFTDDADYLRFEELTIRNRMATVEGFTKEGQLNGASAELNHMPRAFWAAMLDHRLYPEWNRRAHNPAWAEVVPHLRNGAEYLWATRHYLGESLSDVAAVIGRSKHALELVEAGETNLGPTRQAMAEHYVVKQQQIMDEEARIKMPRGLRTKPYFSLEKLEELSQMRSAKSFVHSGHTGKTGRDPSRIQGRYKKPDEKSL